MKSLLITGITLLCISALLFYFSTGYNLEEVQPSHFMGVLGGIGIGLIIIGGLLSLAKYRYENGYSQYSPFYKERK